VIASLRAESLKTRKRWANWIMFGILVAWVIAFGYLILFLVIKLQPGSIRGPVSASVLKHNLFPENFVPVALNNAASIGAAIMIILGALSTASEYGWGTVQTILIQKPGRSAVLAGKLLTLAIATAIFSLAILAIGALASYGVVTIDGSSSAWPSSELIVKGLGALFLQLLVWSAFGAFLGIAFRSTAAAIGGGLTYLFVGEALLGGFLRNTPVVKDILMFLPGINAGGVNAAFPLTVREGAGTTELVTAGRGVVTLLVYLAAFTILSFLIFRRRDVAGG
jgi:ABC-2 type transport system permease protein